MKLGYVQSCNCEILFSFYYIQAVSKWKPIADGMGFTVEVCIRNLHCKSVLLRLLYTHIQYWFIVSLDFPVKNGGALVELSSQCFPQRGTGGAVPPFTEVM